ncbi:maltose-binding periplasmic protein [Photobacterium damselae subsp. piscicida]|uniref:sugar ABC transporter substrate-binding protein n=1 Tax=Photobacterium damselae TaxID=38293 RepID=UPI0002FD3B11|nr:extracellular solute-binding protein [Photobacterium damselae]BBC41662.1 maltose-binding periplasmic protein [Photobacterium damselae subsp. piscicida]
MFRCFILLLILVPCVANARITLWHSHQSTAYIDGLVSRYEKETGIQVSVVQFDPEKIKAELLLGAQYGGLPDLILVPSDFLGLYKQMKLSSISKQWIHTDFEPAVGETAIVNGKYRGIPIIQGNHLLLYYNKTMVKVPVKTWSQLRHQQKSFAAKQIMPIGWNYNDMYFFMPFLLASDGWPIKNNQIDLNSLGMIRALKYYHSLAVNKVIDENCGYHCAQLGFIQGKSAYAINGDWAYDDIKKEMGDNVGLAMLPSLNGHKMHGLKSTFVLAMPEFDQRSVLVQNQLKRFIEFVQRKANQKWVYDKYHLLPVSNSLFLQLKKTATGDN